MVKMVIINAGYKYKVTFCLNPFVFLEAKIPPFTRTPPVFPNTLYGETAWSILGLFPPGKTMDNTRKDSR